MAGDALAPCIAKSTSAEVLKTKYKQTIILYEQGFQLHVPISMSIN